MNFLIPDKKPTDVADNNVGKMTDNEIVKALECCVTKEDCDGCPYDEINDCIKGHEEDILDLINRQKAEIDNLNIELQAMRGAANSYKAENKHLKESNRILTQENFWGHKLIEQLKESAGR